MSVNTRVHIGYYLVCTMSRAKSLYNGRFCSKDADHETSDLDLFCPRCGSKIIAGAREEMEYVGFHDGEDDDSPDFWGNYNTTFEWIAPDWVGMDKEGVEILLPDNGCTSIDADNEGEHELHPLNQVRPFPEDIAQLIKDFKYTNVEVKYGVLVQVS